MFCIDVETMSKSSEAVILSLAVVQFDLDDKRSCDDLRKDAFFVKFDAKDQMVRLNRNASKSTIEWWKKQCDLVKNQSFIPDKNRDVKIEDGLEMMRTWSKSFKNESDKSIVWVRGNLDQLVIDSMEEQIGIEPVFHYTRWRDVRTAIDIFYGTSNGYCDIEGFDRKSVIKHCPINDCVIDVQMLLHGKPND